MNFNKYKTLPKQLDINFGGFLYKKFFKKLILDRRKSLGRKKGSIVSWHRGGGVRKNYRCLINYQNLDKIQYGILRSIEYDPNRSAFIGLLQFNNGSFSYIVVSSQNYIGQIIKLNNNNNNNLNCIKIGDFIKLKEIPKGFSIYNLEKYPNSGAVYSKAAGASSILLTKNALYTKIKLPSGEERLFDSNCLASLGICSNKYKKFNKKYKAGTNRLLNKRPTVRGVVMNPIDHPHGGGEAKSGPGRPSVSPWGKLTKGVPTRNKRKLNRLIIKRRK